MTLHNLESNMTPWVGAGTGEEINEDDCGRAECYRGLAASADDGDHRVSAATSPVLPRRLRDVRRVEEKSGSFVYRSITGIVRNVFLQSSPYDCQVGLTIEQEGGIGPSMEDVSLGHRCEDSYGIVPFQIGLLGQRVRYARRETRTSGGISSSERLDVLSGILEGSVYRSPFSDYYQKCAPVDNNEARFVHDGSDL